MEKLFGTILAPIMRVIYNFCGNYGLSIVLFTIFTKLIMYYWNRKSHIGSAKVNKLAPQMAKIRKQYANNQEKMIAEQQKLYKEVGYNQFSGCTTLLIQFPILFGVLDVVYRPLTHIVKLGKDTISKASEILETVFIKSGKNGYDANLAQYAEELEALGISKANITNRPELELIKLSNDAELCNSIFGESYADFFDKVRDFGATNTFLGIDLSQTPTFSPEKWTAAAIMLALIPILSGVVQLVMTFYTQHQQKKSNPDAMKNMGCMNVMLYGMPLFSVYLALTFPAGVGFYWLCSSLFSFLITIFMYIYYTPKRIDVIIEKDKIKAQNKKPSRFEQMLEEQRALLEQQNGTAPARKSNDEENGMSRSELQAYNRKLINDARKRMAEKYGDEYKED